MAETIKNLLLGFSTSFDMGNSLRKRMRHDQAMFLMEFRKQQAEIRKKRLELDRLIHANPWQDVGTILTESMQIVKDEKEHESFQEKA